MARAAPTVLLVVALLAPGALAWDQYHGGPGRNGIATLPPGVLDVVANVVGPEGVPWSASFASAVPTPHGALLTRADEAGCWLETVTDLRSLVGEAAAIDGCEVGTFRGMFAYDAQTDAVFACVSGPRGSRQLQALDRATGDLRWGMSAESLPQPPNVFPYWNCGGGAYDAAARELVVPFYSFYNSQGLGKLVSVDGTTGTINWVADVPMRPDPVGIGGLPGDPTSVTPLGAPRTVTLTETGIAVLSVTAGLGSGTSSTSGGVNTFEAVLTLFDRSGTYVTTHRSAMGGDEPVSRAGSGSWYAAAHGPLVGLAFGGDVVQVNPQQGNIVARAPIVAVDPSFNYIWWPAPAWTRDRLVVDRKSVV